MKFWYIWCTLGSILLIFGIWDKLHHTYYLKQLKIRINVNGTRGKSTVTRLITATLCEAGFKAFGKTTGSAARLIFWDKPEEPILRKAGKANIKEQRMVVKTAVKAGAECLVSECMAVMPEYQRVFAEQLLKNNIGVIVNTLPDHLDVMGPTLKDAAKALSATIPQNGLVVLLKDEFFDFYTEVARKRNCQVRVAEPNQISDAFLKQFNYLVFPENIALALEVALALGIESEVAYRGMLKAQPDPGVLTIRPIKIRGKRFLFANAFAANDPVSTLAIYKRLMQLGYGIYPLVVVINCREDRVERTKQLTDQVLSLIPCTHIVAIGKATNYVMQCYQRKMFQTGTFWDLEDVSLTDTLSILNSLPGNSLIFGIGNIHGTATQLMAAFDQEDQDKVWWSQWEEEKQIVHI